MRANEGLSASACALLALSLIPLSGAGCVASQTNREPMLTNPARYASWLGEDSDSVTDGPSHTGQELFAKQSYEGSLRLPLSEDWRWQMSDPGHWAISRMELGAPIVSGDHVLVGNSRAPGLFVLERSTGRLLKTIPMEGPVQAPPVALANGWLVVDVFGHLQRFDNEYKPVWSAPYDCGAGVFRQPTIDGEQALISTANDQVISVDLTKGIWRWSHKRSVTRGDQDLAILGAPAPTVVDDVVVQGFSDGFVVGIDRSNGAELWAIKVGDGRFPDIQAEVLEYDGMLIVSAFGGPTVAMDSKTQAIRWKVDSGAVSTMIMTDESLYVSTGRGALLALNPLNGTTQWRWEPKDKQLGPPVRVGSSLFVGDSTGTIHAIDRYEGKETWRYRPHDGTRLSGVAGAATADGRQLLFVSAGGSVHALIGASSLAGDLSEEPRVRRDRQLGW